MHYTRRYRDFEYAVDVIAPASLLSGEPFVAHCRAIVEHRSDGTEHRIPLGFIAHGTTDTEARNAIDVQVCRLIDRQHPPPPREPVAS